MKDTRTDAERRYDSLRDGSAYFSDNDDEPCPACEGAGCSECDGSPLTEEELREDRWLAVMEHIAALPEPQKSEAIGYAIGVIDGMLAARA